MLLRILDWQCVLHEFGFVFIFLHISQSDQYIISFFHFIHIHTYICVYVWLGGWKFRPKLLSGNNVHRKCFGQLFSRFFLCLLIESCSCWDIEMGTSRWRHLAGKHYVLEVFFSHWMQRSCKEIRNSMGNNNLHSNFVFRQNARESFKNGRIRAVSNRPPFLSNFR
jgi:hypothetical protein